MRSLAVLLLIGSLSRPAAAQVRMTRAELEGAAQKDSNDPVLHYNLAQAYAREKRGREAKREYLAAMRIDPQFEPAVVALARMAEAGRPMAIILRVCNRYVLIGGRPPDQNDSTTLLFQRAFMLDPLQDIREGWRFPDYWESTCRRAVDHFQHGDYRWARDQFDTVLAKMAQKNDTDPGIASIRWYHLLASVNLGDYDRAIEDGEALLDHALRKEIADSIRPDERLSHEYEWVLAHLHERVQHDQEAERLYKRAVEDNLGQYMAHVELANIYEAQNRLVEAMTERELAMAADVGDASLELQAGLTYEYARHFAEADTVLRQAITDNPRETRSYYVLGLVDLQLGKADDARKAFDQFIALAPSRYTTMLDDARRRRAALN